MSKLIPLFAAAALCTSAAFLARAEEEKTIKGEGQCAKCELKEKPTCQAVVIVKEDGKDVKYFMAKNKVANGFHKNICTEKKTVKATGTVKEEKGEKIMTASKIEVVEE